MQKASTYVSRGILPPAAEQIPFSVTYHGKAYSDPYAWLKRRDDPRVRAYLQAENNYTEQLMAPLRPLEEELYAELHSRLEEDDTLPPDRDGEYLYYTRTEKGKQYQIHCRRKGGDDAPEEIILDENDLAATSAFFHLGIFNISPDHRLLAYAIDTTGAEEYTLYFMDIQSRLLLPDSVASVSDFEWATESIYFLTLQDTTRRAYQLVRGELGRGLSMLYEEKDALFYMDLAKSKDDRYIFPSRASKDTSEVWMIPTATPHAAMRSVYGVRPKVLYGVDAREDTLYVLEYGATPYGRLLSLPAAELGHGAWRELVPESKVIIESIECFKDHILSFEREEGIQQLSIVHPTTGARKKITFPEPLRAISEWTNYEYASSTFRISYSSFVTPTQIREYDFATGEYTILKQKFAGTDFDSTAYTQERTWATAKDGTQIPVSLVYKRSLFKGDGTNPMFLYGYGSYGEIYDAAFSVAGLSLLNRGFIFAIAHIRGGGEFGRPWYEAGKLATKMNTFTDFIACMEHVIAANYTSSAKLTIGGRSAGGLLIGVVVSMRPELMRAAIVGVPFVDVAHTMMDSSLTSTTLEYEEWGNPHVREEFEFMTSYSPYETVRAQAYPHLLVTAGLYDPLVNYWEPAKWVAKLRATKTDDHILLLKTNMEAGHHGSLGRYDALKREAFEYAFLLDAVA